ncbi:hypothetical protein RA178_09300 [Shewanella oncorhynchi]|uniref:Uncharacterized protein n=1 Tax=Shewanella oncorhynchi TaxID=2726434 RepID=A0AA50Q7E0_9GAMM|nr:MULTISPECIES: hypothetical protein [Shewanella]MCU8004359.1 hypothetical protein [Shewanella sp. SM96]WMB74767.1 hypothetical protein RA178_09300 [Shewanella oncorhynchi]
MNDRLNLAIAENIEIKARIVELEQQVAMLSKRPEFDLSTVQVREQAVIARLDRMSLKADNLNELN